VSSYASKGNGIGDRRERPAPESTPPSLRGFWAPFALALLAGVAVRTYALQSQILVDDEWHAIHQLLRHDSYLGLFHLASNDHSPPLTMLYRALANTVGLSETLMRLPSLAAGLLALFALPLLLRPIVGDGSALAFAFLLGLSPLHVFYSRYARPYAIVMLAGFLALLAFHAWWSTGRGRALFWFVLAGVIAPVLNLPALPLILAPFVWAVSRDVRRPMRVTPRRLATAGVPLLLGWLILLGPLVALADREALAGKIARAPVDLRALVEAAPFFLGSANLVAQAILSALALAGMATLWRRDRSWTSFMLTVAVVDLACLLVAGVHGTQYGIVLARYAIGVLPVVLVFVASGAARLVAAVPALHASSARHWLAAAGVGLLALLGPLPATFTRPNNFTNHASLQHSYAPSYFAEFRPSVHLATYDALARNPPGACLVIEAPLSVWHSYAYYQRLHRQRVAIGLTGSAAEGQMPADDRRFRFANAVHLGDPEGLARLRANYIILHKDMAREMGDPFGQGSPPMDHWVTRLTARYGAPVVDDRWLAVFRIAPGSACAVGLASHAVPLAPKLGVATATRSLFRGRAAGESNSDPAD